MIQFIFSDKYMYSPRESLRHFLSKKVQQVFHSTQLEVIWPKEFLKSMHRNKSAKMAIWQKIATLPFWHFCPCASISKIFLLNDFSLSVMKDQLHSFAQKVSLAPSRAVHVLIREDKLNYFKFPSLDFKNSFCFRQLG